ncbi:MAG: urease subunit beta [Clostridiaceae bacterium]
MIPGEVIVKEGTIKCNEGKEAVKLTVINTGDRPIQVGSHFHFFEVNKALDFDRNIAYGKHLDIPSGTAIRFEPGEEKEVSMVEFGGTGEIYGLNSLTQGNYRDGKVKETACKKAKESGFKGVK